MQPNDAAAAGGGAPAPAAGASLAGLAVSVLTNPLVAASFTGILFNLTGPSRATSASRSLRRALLTPQLKAGSLYRGGKRD